MLRVVGYVGCLALLAMAVLVGVAEHASDVIVGGIVASGLMSLVLSEDA